MRLTQQRLILRTIGNPHDIVLIEQKLQPGVLELDVLTGFEIELNMMFNCYKFDLSLTEILVP
jgi:hypothetical protein